MLWEPLLKPPVMQEKHPSSKCLLPVADFPLGQATPANSLWREEVEAKGSVCAPFLGHDVPPAKTCSSTLTLWFQGNPGCRQIKMQVALQEANQQPNKKGPWDGGCLPPQLLHGCSITFPAPCTGCVLERATADYHHASHVRGMCWKEHYSSQPPTTPCLKLKA